MSRISFTNYLVSFGLCIIIYISLIPVLFDTSYGCAYILDDKEYSQQLVYYTNSFDVSIHDGPKLQNDLNTLGNRIAVLESKMVHDNTNKTLLHVPRWYNSKDDYYFKIQKKSFIHIIFPFY